MVLVLRVCNQSRLLISNDSGKLLSSLFGQGETAHFHRKIINITGVAGAVLQLVALSIN